MIKFLTLFTFFIFFSQYAKAVNKLDYKITSVDCTTTDPSGSCPYDYVSITLTHDPAAGEIVFDQIKANGSTDSQILNTENVHDGKLKTLAVDADMKYINFMSSGEIMGSTEYVTERTSWTIQFYQIDANHAVLIESLSIVDESGTVNSGQVTVKLEK